MKAKKAAALRARCQALFDAWIAATGLGYWDITINYIDDTSEFTKPNGNQVAMRTYVMWQYLDIRIDVCLPHIKHMDDDQLEYVIVHELCHALVNELRENDADGKHEERVVTHLAKALRWTRDLQSNNNKEQK